MSACGNPKCRASSGIHDGLTFGSGLLDYMGYWEHPCSVCARAHEKAYPEDGPCWPFTREQIAEMFPAPIPSKETP